MVDNNILCVLLRHTLYSSKVLETLEDFTIAFVVLIVMSAILIYLNSNSDE